MTININYVLSDLSSFIDIKGRIVLLFISLICCYSLIAQPTISSFTPTSGPIGTSVSITGTGFDTTLANNIVFFGATRATVSAATVSTLIVIVPSGATFQPISVLVNGLITYSSAPFVVTFEGGGIINDSSFTYKSNYATGTSPSAVLIGDLDGDGKSDLVVANSYNNTVSVLRNTTTAAGVIDFALSVGFSTGSKPFSVSIGDLDGDGKPDLAVANYSSSNVSVLRNTSSGEGVITFAAKVNYSTGYAPGSVSMGDLDGDGKLDLVVTNAGNATVSVLRNKSTDAGMISFATRVYYASGSWPYSVSISDLDGDGKPDLAVANRSSNTVSVLRNTSTGTGAIGFSSKVDYATGSEPRSVSIGDLDSDGKPDLVVANYSSNTISAFKNISTGAGLISFTPKADFATGNKPRSVSIGDLDGDGRPDLVVANLSVPSISILRNLSATAGMISYASRVEYSTGLASSSAAVGDLDGDGKSDWVVNINSGVSVFRNAIGTDIISFSFPEQKVLTNIGTGKIAIEVPHGTDVATLVATFMLSSGAAAAVSGTQQLSGTTANDFTSAVTYSVTTGDGKTTQDWVVNVTVAPPLPTITSFIPTSGPIGTSVVITGTNFDDAPANNFVFFGATRATVSAATESSITVTVPSGASYQPITVSVNGLIAYASAPFIVNFDGGGTIDASSFTSKIDYSTGTNPTSVSIGDLDIDGKSDLAVVNYSSNTVSVYRNTSIGAGVISYAAKLDYATRSNPESVAIGDLDGDGKYDMAVVNFNSSNSNSTVSVVRNTSTGAGVISYGNKVDYVAGALPVSISIGDLDSDGKPDMAWGHLNGNTVSILRNTRNSSTEAGVFSFATKTDFTTGLGTSSVSIGDLDGDGKPDLAVANRTSNTVSVLRNTSTGAGVISFASNVDYATGTEPTSVSIGDLDGDGKSDLAVVNRVSNTVSILRNTSTGAGVISYATRVDYETGKYPTSLSINDLDGDGSPDLAVVNYSSNTVSVYKNTKTGAGVISFAAKVDHSAGKNPTSVSIGDLDGDGKPDLAVENSGSATVSVFRNMIGPNTATDITSFSFLEQIGEAILGIGTIDIEVTFDADITSLIPTITLSEGATISPLSGVAQDFSNPVTYTVTAENGTAKQDWVITVTRNTIGLNTATDITSFSFLEQIGEAILGIGTIDIEVTFDADITSLIPTITLSEGATISPLSGVAEDFSNPVTYTVTAENGTAKQDWVITVTQGPLGLEEFEDIRIYPNPTSEKVNISGIEGVYSVQLLNFAGQTMFNGTNKHTVSLSGMSNGIYYLKIVLECGEMNVWKLIKK